MFALMIAAQRGYEIIINESFSITWNGGESDDENSHRMGRSHSFR